MYTYIYSAGLSGYKIINGEYLRIQCEPVVFVSKHYTSVRLEGLRWTTQKLLWV
jgi:hypothetical protein